MKKQILALAMAITIATTATISTAHDGVKNPTVEAWMDEMDAISDGMKTIGGMAKGQIKFNAMAAQASVKMIAKKAGRVPKMFKKQATDPTSEASPDIWQNWDDFTAKANALNVAANGVDASTKDGLRQAMTELGGACRSCHKAYKN